MLPKHRSPTHPGEILQEEFLTPLGITQMALAMHLKWPHAKINELIKGKRGITPAIALGLADAFGTRAEMWMNLQIHFDLWHAQQKHEKKRKIVKVA